MSGAPGGPPLFIKPQEVPGPQEDSNSFYASGQHTKCEGPISLIRKRLLMFGGAVKQVVIRREVR